MEGLEVLSPDFIEIALKSMSIGDVATLADTNRTWSDWVENHLNFIAEEYELPYGKSISEIIQHSWSLEALASTRVK